jgi:DNA-directed RNA polymerase specialized sigma subunit
MVAVPTHRWRPDREPDPETTRIADVITSKRPLGGFAQRLGAVGRPGHARSIRIDLGGSEAGPRIDALMAPSPDREPGQQRFDDQRVEDLAAAAGANHRPDRAEHERLLQAAGRGDHRACEALTEAHLDWVVAAARERAERGLSQADLFQEGTIGLMEAIRAFSSSHRHDFETFARERVALQMDRALGAEDKAVQDGKMLLQAAQDYVRAEFSVRRELGRAATTAELAAKLEWTVQRTEEIGQMVADAQRRHDEEILQYLEPGDIDLDALFEDRHELDGK